MSITVVDETTGSNTNNTPSDNPKNTNIFVDTGRGNFSSNKVYF